MNHASLFSGIGAPEVAAEMLGWRNVFHCEINPFGRAVLEYWFPDSDSYEDITKTDFTQYRGRVDVLTGGFPCQPFSYAGKRGGQEDARYLWPQMLRVIGEVRPTWVIGENVAGITTMVEGGILTDLGGETSLFGEEGDVHRFMLEQRFTIERICHDLECAGYTVQPMLIPAAATGAPHRRDRVFFLAHVADANDHNAGRTPGADAGAGREERLQERNEVQFAGEPSEVRFSLHGTAADTHGERYEECDPAAFTGGTARGIKHNDNKRDASDTHGKGLQEPQQPGRGEDRAQDTGGVHDRTERSGAHGHPADTQREGLEGQDNARCEEAGRAGVRGNAAGHDWACDGSLLPGNRWREFPTVPPVHRGNDGLPFPLDNLTIPQTKWRNESLKAYGNAICVQVMYELFLAIQEVENEKE